MAGFTFETMTAADAAAFKGTDSLFFQSTDPTTVGATYTPASGTTGATVTLTVDGRSLTFNAGAVIGNTHLSFISDGSTINLTNTATTAVADSDAVVIGFDTAKAAVNFTFNVVSGDGDHNIHGGFGNDTVTTTVGGSIDGNNHVWGGLGADTITLGDGNSHVYGGNNVAGEADGNDTIVVGAGSNYVNGNAGDDTITAGTAISTGADRLQGGAGNDIITVKGAAGSVNSVNGNKGDDTISAATSHGSNTLHGGQGDDTITTGLGHDTVFGDLGDDTINVSGVAGDGHLAVMTGGDGADTFVFGAAGAGAAVDLKADGTIDATGPHYGSHTYYQEITDFTVGDDLIDVGSAVAKTDVSVLKTTFASVADAQLAASADTHAVVATQVGGDTYLFWHGGDDVVKLDHVTAANLDYTSFTH